MTDATVSSPTDPEGTRGLPAGVATAGRRAVAAWRRLPFTVSGVAVFLLLALFTGSLWRRAEEASWFPAVAYGVPAFGAGRWWTVLTGPLFALTPWFYLPMVGGFAVLVGLAEWRIGTRRTALVTVLGQVLGLLGTCLFLVAVRGTGWEWADRTAGVLDVGCSAGTLAAAAILTALLRPPWRLRARLALLIFVVVAALYLGSFADLEHLISVGGALAVGPRLVRDLGGKVVTRPSREEWRLLAATGPLVLAVIALVAHFLPADGPLGSTFDPQQGLLDVLVPVAFFALVGRGLRRGRRWAWWTAVVVSALITALGALVLVAVAVAVATRNTADLDVTNPAQSGLHLLLFAALLTVLVAGRRAFRVPSRRRLRRSGVAGDIAAPTALALLERHGGGTLSWMTTWPDNAWFGTADGESFLAYQVHTGVAVALGDPVGPPADTAGAVREFRATCEQCGLVPCLFSVTQPTADAAAAQGWRHVQVAEDTLIDLPDLEFRGKAWQDVRSALNKAKKQGVTFRLVTLADEPWSLVGQVREVSDGWVGDKGLPEMGFTLGGVDEALDRRVRVGLAEDADGLVQGVTSWLPVLGPDGAVRGWTLDVMRRRQDGTFKPVVEFLIASACLAFRDEGAAFVSLSGAPLARAAGDGAPTAVLDRLLDELGQRLEPLYGFRSLHAFKTKFAPRYEPMYLVFRDEADLPRVGLGLTRAYLPDTPLRELVRPGRR